MTSRLAVPAAQTPGQPSGPNPEGRPERGNLITSVAPELTTTTTSHVGASLGWPELRRSARPAIQGLYLIDSNFMQTVL